MANRVRITVRVNLHDLIADAIEEGVAYGWNRAHKHNDAPEPAAIRNEIEQAVMSAICDIVDMSPDDDLG